MTPAQIADLLDAGAANVVPVATALGLAAPGAGLVAEEILVAVLKLGAILVRSGLNEPAKITRIAEIDWESAYKAVDAAEDAKFKTP